MIKIERRQIIMAFMTVKFFSECLGMQTEVYVLIPQGKAVSENGYKCLYLLHGLSDDHTIWMRRTSIERYADRYGICVVMPNVGRSWYTNTAYGARYYDFTAHELPARMREFFRISDKREDNYVAGLSMGGYGALKIGLRECESFACCAGLSSAADIASRTNREDIGSIFGGENAVPDDDDLFKLAEKYAHNGHKPRIYLGAGLEDSLYSESVAIKEKLVSLGYDVTYRESHGGHTWEFWDEYIVYVLEWMLGKK